MTFRTQHEAVSRIRSKFPHMSQPLFSAAIHGKITGIQLRPGARKLAGYKSTFERERRKTPYANHFRLSPKEAEAFDKYCIAEGRTKQEILREMIQNLVGVKEDV